MSESRFTAVPISALVKEGAGRAVSSIGSIRIPELVLFGLLIAGGGLPISMLGPIPVAHVILGLICAYGVFQRPTRDFGKFQLIVPALVLALFYVGMVSLFADPSAFAAEWQERLLRMSAVTVMMLFLASGRLELRSALLGCFVVLVVNVPLFYAGLVPDTYGGHLTGLIGDKNAAGLAYAVVGLLALITVRSRGAVATIVFVSLAATWLTGSRTSIAAFSAGAAWIVLAPRLPVVGKWVLGAVIAFTVNLLAEDYSQIGVFSDREGSDLLRQRIDAASLERVEQTGFFGQGLGEAYVVLDDRTWFFHNSYWSALVEGGWPWVVFLVVISVLVMVRPFKGRVPERQYLAQGAGIAVLICATRLGEVFYTNVWGIALGAGLFLLSAKRSGDHLEASSKPETTLREGGGS
ncbi:ABC transporter permease [Brachybacterium sp. p3-SID1565]|uniref:ABC transporter permease n=1 Tax=Brachybacterium sp. p3-SID1565 TaxID=2916046 RepID=UPI0021A65F33|nr:ABC transporter permease [Brachybacterium sp. p3-SID1565]MCT1385965.1 ABC transporter permease [Brachybacterium sp. p3-SID1565]